LPRNCNPKQLFFVDVDGDGASDLLYVGPDRVILWRNFGGQRFAPPVEIDGTPYCSVENLRLTDLLGTGMTGILWSGLRTTHRSGYRFLSFSDTKPHLLTKVREGTGVEIEIEYDTSCQHAIRDLQSGRPWSTHLPMPVPVVRRIINRDLVTG